jgi:AraC-like DNA-binding protein
VFQVPSMDRVFLDRLQAIVEENLGDESFGVEEMARELGMSRTSIHRRLKSTYRQIARPGHPRIPPAAGL